MRQLSLLPTSPKFEKIRYFWSNTQGDAGSIQAPSIRYQNQTAGLQGVDLLALELLRIEIHLCHFRQHSRCVACLNHSRQVGERRKPRNHSGAEFLLGESFLPACEKLAARHQIRRGGLLNE
ncbi:MAG: hypothetical protein WCS43_14135 [Verrucomicrobiota bacterium]